MAKKQYKERSKTDIYMGSSTVKTLKNQLVCPRNIIGQSEMGASLNLQKGRKKKKKKRIGHVSCGK